MRYYTTLIAVLAIKYGLACDFCGCFMGITPYDNQSNICFLYRYKSYNGYSHTDQQHNLFPQTYSATSTGNGTNNGTIANANAGGLRHSGPSAPGTSEPEHSQRDYEIYTTAELRAKYFIHKRVELNSIIPFIMNSSRLDSEKQKIQGVGDITLLAAYHLVSDILTEKFQNRLIIGAGFKLPTGSYSAKNSDNERIDFLLQAGTGSTDYIGYLNYIFAYKKAGLSLNSTYKINGTNKYHEQVSNSSTNYLNIFYKFRQQNNLKLFPSLQAYYEHTKGVYLGAVYQGGTRTNSLMAGVGLDLFYKNISLNTAFQLPVYEENIKNNMATAGKFMIGLTYSFNQKNYLIRSKQSSNK